MYNTELTDDEYMIIRLYRGLNDLGKEKVHLFVRDLHENIYKKYVKGNENKVIPFPQKNKLLF